MGEIKFKFYGKLLKLITLWSAISIFNKLYNLSFKFGFQKCGERIPNYGHYFYHYTVIVDTYNLKLRNSYSRYKVVKPQTR